MKKISVEELVDYKILPFNIYNEDGEIIVNAGDNLTPGKLLQLRYIENLYCEEEEQQIKESLEMNEGFSIENIHSIEQEEDPLENIINRHSPIDENSQLQLKSIYKKAYTALATNIDKDSVKQIKTIRDRLLDNLMPIIAKTHKKSQLKIIGDYEKYHGLNVALLAAMLAKKMNFSDAQLADVTLAAILHDIGKIRLPKEFHHNYYENNTSQSNNIYELHPEVGYKILKNEMHFPEDICVVALEHHEKNDGSGYPHGVSSDLIHPYSQIVSICNIYDNLISGKSAIIVNSPQEAVKKIIEMGSEWFSPGVLYSFVYMTSYHDDISLDELGRIGNLNWE